MIENSKAQMSTCFESLSPVEQKQLRIYINGLIQGALAYSKTFTVSDLVGGKFSYHWKHTPLRFIYNWHRTKWEPKCLPADLDLISSNESGKDVGRIVKYIMSEDKNRVYRLVGTEQRKYPINVYELIDIKNCE